MSKPVEDKTSKDTSKTGDSSRKPGGSGASPAVTQPGTPPIAKTPGDKAPPKTGMSGPATAK